MKHSSILHSPTTTFSSWSWKILTFFKAVLSLILPSVEVEKITSLETEKPMTVDYFLHGVRFDILAKELKKFIDMEV